MLYIDGIGYKIDVMSVKRTADFLDKYAERTENGDLERELIGVYFNYKLQLGPGVDRAEYARLWEKNYWKNLTVNFSAKKPARI